MVKRSIITDIWLELRSLHNKLDDVQKMLYTQITLPVVLPEEKYGDLPDHLRRTMKSLSQLDLPVQASDVACVTGRCRAIESAYLNQLTRLGWLNKSKQKKNTVFSVKEVNVKYVSE